MEPLRDLLRNFHLFAAALAVLSVLLIFAGYQYVAAGVQLSLIVIAGAMGK